MVPCDICGSTEKGKRKDVCLQFCDNKQSVYQIHADMCKKCRKKINKSIVKTMNKIEFFNPGHVIT